MKKPHGIDPKTDQTKIGKDWIPSPEAMAQIFLSAYSLDDAYARWINYEARVFNVFDRLEEKRRKAGKL